MRRFGVIVDGTCLLCNSHQSHARIFFECSYSQIILRDYPVQLSLSSQETLDGNFILVRTCNITKQVTCLFLATSFHSIWMERNKRIHNSGHSLTAKDLLVEIKAKVRSKLYTCKPFKDSVRRNPSLYTIIFSLLLFKLVDMIYHQLSGCLSRLAVQLFTRGMPLALFAFSRNKFYYLPKKTVHFNYHRQ